MNCNEELLDGARAAYLAARGESDLISIKEAATLVDRTVPTLKKWVKKSEINGIRENPEFQDFIKFKVQEINGTLHRNGYSIKHQND